MISYISHRRTVPGGESAQPITFLMLGERVAFSKKAKHHRLWFSDNTGLYLCQIILQWNIPIEKGL